MLPMSQHCAVATDTILSLTHCKLQMHTNLAGDDPPNQHCVYSFGKGLNVTHVYARFTYVRNSLADFMESHNPSPWLSLVLLQFKLQQHSWGCNSGNRLRWNYCRRSAKVICPSWTKYCSTVTSFLNEYMPCRGSSVGYYYHDENTPLLWAVSIF